MDRREFLAGAMASLGGFGLPPHIRAESQPRRRPNVLMLMSDQHKRSCMGADGDSVAITPHLDRLAGESVRFTDAYCTNPVCTPSRASLMTGLYSHNHEAQNNALPYSSRHKTLAHHFGASGYMTALIGKMHWVDGQTHGFDYRLEFNDWYQYLGPKTKLYADELGRPNSGSGLPEIDDLWREEGDPWRGHRDLDNREGSVAVGRISKLEEKDHFDSFVARESVRFLREHGTRDQPFFLISSFLKPHDPFMPAERFAKMFRPEDMKLPESWGKADVQHLPQEVQESIKLNGPTPELRDEHEAKRRIAFYYANLAQMDDCVGQVIKALEDLKLDRDTIIVYTSDHGEMLGDLGLWQKFQFYEGSCGIPLMIRVPGVQPGVCSTPVSQVSFSKTITELANVREVAPNDGRSFADLVHHPRSRVSYGPVFAEYVLGSKHAKYLIRDGEFKYTFWTHDTPELYNLRSDPQELHNLACISEYAADAARLKRKLFEWHRPEEA